MTLSTLQSQITIAGTGIATSFSFPFVANAPSDIAVSFIDANSNVTPLTTTQYSITLNPLVPGALWQIGGVISYPLVGSPIAIGTSLLIQRVVPLLQETSIQNQGNFYAQVTEEALDTLCMEIQQVAARTGQFRGTWATAIAYNLGDVVIDGVNGANTGNFYMCVLANTSGVWATDLANGDWTLMINMVAINAAVASAAASAATATTQAGIATAQAANAATSASSSATSATTATTEAGIATTQAGNAAASATAAAASAASVIGLTATSTTSQAIQSGAVTFTTQANKGFFAGQQIIIASNANASNYMHGTVTSYSGTTLVTNITDTGGSGTHTDWNISVSGTQGSVGPAGAGAAPAGTSGQIQYFSLTSNTFAAFTLGGDATLALPSGTITVTKTAGVAFATSATTDTTNASNISSGTLGSARGGAGTVNGLLKAAGNGVVSLALSSTDYQMPITLTTTGTLGTATLINNVLNIPVYAGGGGVAGVSSLTGDGTLFNNLASSGAVALTRPTATAESLYGNNSTSSLVPTFITSPIVSGTSTAASFIPTSNTLPNMGMAGASGSLTVISNANVAAGYFQGSGTGADVATFTSQSAGTGPYLGVTSSGTNAPLNLATKGTGQFNFYSNAGSTLLATLTNAGNLTLDIAGANMTAGTFTVLSSVAPTNGLYVPSSNTLAITSNSHPVASFNSPGAGGDYFELQNVASSGISAVTAPTACTIALAGAGAGNLSSGNYSYKITYVGTLGETALGTISNIVNVTSPGSNGQMSLTSIPVSGSGTVTARNIYRTMAGGNTYFFLHQITDNTTTTYTDNIADTSLNWSGPTAQAQIPTYIVIGPTASGGDTSVGIQYKALGTTTTGFQVNGSVGKLFNQGDTQTTGTHDFYCNNQIACRITDNYANVNQTYPGAVNGYPVISSGWGDITSSGDAFAGMISVEAPSIYPSHTPTGLSLLIGSKGPTGQIHFVSNGAIGHVTVGNVQGSNPTANDVYVGNNSIRLQGSITASGFDPTISTQYWNAGADIGINMQFYNQGTGGFNFKTDNTATTILNLSRSASGGDGINITAQTAGNGPLLQTISSSANVPLNISSKGTGAVNIATRAGSQLQCIFNDTNSTLNVLTITGGASGSGPTIGIGGASVQTNAGITYKTLGTGQHTFQAGGANLVQIGGGTSSVNSISLQAATTGNQPSISAQITGGNPGLLIYTTDTGPINFKTNNTANAVLTLNNSGSVQLNSGTITTYKAISTAGLGVPAIYGYGRVTAVTNATSSGIASYTVSASDGSFIVSGNVLVTATTAASMTMTVTYTDEGSNSRTLTLTFSQITGTLLTAITNVTGVGAYEGVPLHIRCKASTSITISTAGTVTGITYNAEGMITQIS